MPEAVTDNDRYVVISTDSHAGGSMEQYREYLDAEWRDEFDAWRDKYRNPFRDLQDDGRTRNWDSDLRQQIQEHGKPYCSLIQHWSVLSAVGPVVSYRQDMDEFCLPAAHPWGGATYHALAMLSEGMAKAKTTDPVKVAYAMEGLTFKSFNGEVTMRKTDHQMQQPLFILKWVPVDAKNPYNVENTGMTFSSVKSFDSYVSSTPTSCQMKRPS